MFKKLLLASTLFTALLFAGKTMRVYTSDGTTDFVISTVDSVKFIDNSGPSGMKLIPAKDSSFQMGSSDGPSDEKPVHSVRFSHDYWMDSVEVTQGVYEGVMRDVYNAYDTPLWTNKLGLGEFYPVYNINWYDAVLYCNALSKQKGFDTVYSYSGLTGIPGNGCVLNDVVIQYEKKGFRLPTEAEWEYACRAGSRTDYFWGSDASFSIVDLYAVYSNNSEIKGEHSPEYGTHIVATKKANTFGLYDMSGNVWEWCGDWHSAHYYGESSEVSPIGPVKGVKRVVRGGNWISGSSYLRSSQRLSDSPEYQYIGGFRVVLPVL